MVVRYLSEDELTHHGIKGMKWGVRRYQNPDGSLTNAGKKRLFNELKKTEYVKRKSSRNAGYVRDKNAENLIRKYADRKDIEQYKKATKKSSDAFATLDEYADENFDHLGNKKYLEYSRKFEQADKERHQILENISNKLIGKYSNKPLIKVSAFNKKKGTEVVYNLLEEIAWEEISEEEVFGMPYEKIPDKYKS